MRVRKLLAVLAVTTLTAGVGVVAMDSAPSGAAETIGYTTVWSDGCQLATIDLATAVVTPLGAFSSSSCVTDLAVSPEGAVFGLLNLKDGGLDTRLVTFDLTNGAATSHVITGNFTTSFPNDGGLAFAPDGSLLAQFATNESGCAPSGSTCLYRVDPATFVATLIGPSGQGDDPFFSLTAACSGTTLGTQFQEQAVPNSSDVTAAEFDQRVTSWNTSNGAATPGANINENVNVAGIEFDRVSGPLYLLGSEQAPPPPVIDGEAPVEPQTTDNVTLYTLDAATGALTPIADVPDSEMALNALAIPGTCAAPAAVELQPRFTG